MLRRSPRTHRWQRSSRKARIAKRKRYDRLDESLVLFYLCSRNNQGRGDDAGIREWNNRPGIRGLGMAGVWLDRPHERSSGQKQRLLAGSARGHADLVPILFVGGPVRAALCL